MDRTCLWIERRRETNYIITCRSIFVGKAERKTLITRYNCNTFPGQYRVVIAVYRLSLNRARNSSVLRHYGIQTANNDLFVVGSKETYRSVKFHRHRYILSLTKNFKRSLQTLISSYTIEKNRIVRNFELENTHICITYNWANTDRILDN